MIWIPDVRTRTELSPPFHRKDPFLAPSNSGCYGLLGFNGGLPLWGDKASQSSSMVARRGRMYGEGRAAVVPDEMSLLRRARCGDWQVATRSTADHPGGLGGHISVTVCVCMWRSVCTMAGYVGWQGEQRGWAYSRFLEIWRRHRLLPVEGAASASIRCPTTL